MLSGFIDVIEIEAGRNADGDLGYAQKNSLHREAVSFVTLYGSAIA
jgi:hypothetical protein